MIAPLCLAMLICREVRCEAAGNRSLVNLIATARFDALPAVSDRFWVYLDVSDGRGEATLSLRIIDPEGRQLAERFVHADFSQPDEDQTACVPFDRVVFVRAGVHYVQLYAGESLVAERTLSVALSGESADEVDAREEQST